MLSRLSKDDMSLLARYLVRTRRAVSGEGEEEGLLKILRREGAVGLGRGGKLGSAAASAGSGEAILTISETEKDLLRLRGTGEERRDTTGQGKVPGIKPYRIWRG